MECRVCYDRAGVRAVRCPRCEYVYCQSCFKTYLLDHATREACANCKLGFTLDFIRASAGDTYVRTRLRKARLAVYVARETALLPSTQTTLTTSASDPVSRGTVIPCRAPVCRGFVSLADRHCGMCRAVHCTQCWEVRDVGHLCDDGYVKTVDMLKRDSTSCPKCATMIFKTDGCNQMFCTQCHTAFDYRTGKVETGPVHNPHYFEWLRTRPDVDPVPTCDRDPVASLIHTYRVLMYTKKFYYLYYVVFDLLTHFVADMFHNQLPQVERAIEDIDHGRLFGLRCQYLAGRIDTAQWHARIGLAESSRLKKIGMAQAIRAYAHILADTAARLARDTDGRAADAADAMMQAHCFGMVIVEAHRMPTISKLVMAFDKKLRELTDLHSRHETDAQLRLVRP